MMEMWGTVEQLTAETNCAPRLMILACSAFEPTMKPVTLCRKIKGMFLSHKKLVGLDRSHAGSDLLLIAHADELSAFACLVWVDNWSLIGNDSNSMSCFLSATS
jgi:hypothetical protein